MARVWRDGPSARLGKGRTGRKPISASKSSNKTNILEFGLVQAFFSPIAYKQQRRKPPGWQPFWRQLHREMERGEEGSGDWGGWARDCSNSFACKVTVLWRWGG